jgi:Arc-like DNA binding domain
MTSKEDKPFFLRRLPEDLRSQLADRAKESERSLTSEILVRLRQSVRSTDETTA